MAGRYVIEGHWFGRLVHRRVHSASFKKLRAWAEKTHSIGFMDGSGLVLSVRDCAPRERVSEINGYTSLIADCAHYDVTSVADLQAAEKERA